MPTYQYRCRDCDEELEVVQAFTDDALTKCPACKGSLRKVFAAPGISFKGSGFYKNDSRGSTKSTIANGSSSDASGESSSGSGDSSSTKADASTDKKADAKPDKSASTRSEKSSEKKAGSSPVKSGDKS